MRQCDDGCVGGMCVWGCTHDINGKEMPEYAKQRAKERAKLQAFEWDMLQKNRPQRKSAVMEIYAAVTFEKMKA